MPKRIAFLFFLISVSFISCDIFNTRDPEKPSIARSTQAFPSSPQVLLNNLTASLEEKNLQNYIDCFLDSNFHYMPSNRSLIVYPFLSNLWDNKAEYKYFNNLILQLEQSVNISIKLSNTKMTPYSDSTIYSAHYILSIPFKKSTSNSLFEGDLIFTFQQDSRTRWCISSWQDINNSNAACWSDLKGMMYN